MSVKDIIRPLPGMVIKDVPIPEPAVKAGAGARSAAGAICRERGFAKALLVTDVTISALGYADKVMDSLLSEGIAYSVFDKISTEPTLEIIDAGRKAALESGADCIIGLGGGSVMDSCKMIAAGVTLKHIETKLLPQKFLFVPGKTLPIINIPSTAGTGAEITVGAVITDPKKHRKASTVVVGLDVTNVILDSELTVRMPRGVTAACGIDALSHGLEGIVADVKSSEEDEWKSAECIRLVLENLPKVLDNPEDMEARQQMCLAANYGGNAINKQLAGYVHAFAHSIGARYHIAHGNAIAMCILPVMAAEMSFCMSRMAKASRHCGLAEAADGDAAAALKLLDGLAALLQLCDFPKAPAIPDEDMDTLVHMINLDSINYSSPKALSNQQIRSILKAL